jgi:hypothetical protein
MKFYHLLLIVTFNLLLFITEVVSEKCNSNGIFQNDKCNCYKGWYGDTCNIPYCVNGKFIDNGCICPYDTYLKNYTCVSRCIHGIYNKKIDNCMCNDNWTNINNYIWNTNDISFDCDTFKCSSNEQCKQLTNFSYSKCPIKNMNCYCGLTQYGYQNTNVKCMDINMSFLIWFYYLYLDFAKSFVNKVYLSLIILSLPFGSRRFICPYITNIYSYYKLLNSLGCRTSCNGNCVNEVKFRISDDFSLSLFWVKHCLWLYSIVSIISLIIIYGWSLFHILFFYFIISSILLCCSLKICQTIQSTHYYYFNFDRCFQNNQSNVCKYICQSISYPVLFICLPLIRSHPIFPSNLKGGILGYIIGTHIKRDTYQGGNYFIDLLNLDFLNNFRILNEVNYNESISQDNNYISYEDNHNIKYLNKQLEMDDKFIINIEDYIKNECNICNHSKLEWCVWKSCGHILCNDCSKIIYNKKWSCPFCRKSSDLFEIYTNTNSI